MLSGQRLCHCRRHRTEGQTDPARRVELRGSLNGARNLIGSRSMAWTRPAPPLSQPWVRRRQLGTRTGRARRPGQRGRHRRSKRLGKAVVSGLPGGLHPDAVDPKHPVALEQANREREPVPRVRVPPPGNAHSSVDTHNYVAGTTGCARSPELAALAGRLIIPTVSLADLTACTRS